MRKYSEINIKFLQWKIQQDASVYQNFIIPYFIWSSTCFGLHTAHHQEPKTALAASGFAYVEGCRMCSCWTLSGSVCYLTSSNNCTSVRGSVHHSTIITVKNPTRCNSVSKFYHSLFYMKLNMFRATHRPSSWAQNCTGILGFCIRGRLSDVQLLDVVR